MKFANLLHNILNITIALLAALEVFDWSAFLEPGLAIKVAGACAMAKILLNVTRDGVAGLYAEQPPIAPVASDDPMQDVQ